MVKFDYNYKEMTLANGEKPKPQTINMYRASLNKLAKEGFTNRNDILTRQEDLIKTISVIYDTNHKKRTALSAAFRVLGNIPNEKRTLLYDYFQKCKDPKPEEPKQEEE